MSNILDHVWWSMLQNLNLACWIIPYEDFLLGREVDFTPNEQPITASIKPATTPFNLSNFMGNFVIMAVILQLWHFYNLDYLVKNLYLP